MSVKASIFRIEKSIEEKKRIQKNPSLRKQDVVSTMNKLKKYTHCEMDPTAILGVVSSILPLVNHNPGPRGTYATGMAKQAVSAIDRNAPYHFGSSSRHYLVYPTPPLFKSQMNELLGLDTHPYGETVVLAIATYGGWNQEDAVIMNKASIDRGLFLMFTYFTITSILKSHVKSGDSIISERFGIPKKSKKSGENIFSALDSNGIPRIGAKIEKGYAIIGKIQVVKTPTKQEEFDASTYAKLDEAGIVDAIFVSNKTLEKIVKVKIRKLTSPEVGNKVASRHGQKSTIAKIEPEENLPFSMKSGIRPDIIMSPFAIPGRMSMGQLIEMVASKVAALRGERVNATAFQNFDLDKFRRNLRAYGFDEWGYETLVLGQTGETLSAQIFIGPCYYQVMTHFAAGKVQARPAFGAVNALTRQPVQGRANEGGLRLGEMERDALVAHGVPAVLQDRLCKSSDAFTAVLCRKCGTFASVNHVTKKYSCYTCGPESNFGRCEIPYVYKYLVDLLAGAGVRMSLRFSSSEPQVTENYELGPESQPSIGPAVRGSLRSSSEFGSPIQRVSQQDIPEGKQEI
jgi:DNA-directed RNA polymerase subunit B